MIGRGRPQIISFEEFTFAVIAFAGTKWNTDEALVLGQRPRALMMEAQGKEAASVTSIRSSFIGYEVYFECLDIVLKSTLLNVRRRGDLAVRHRTRSERNP